jgi:hypothetical protein
MEGVYVANYYENTAELDRFARDSEQRMGQDIGGKDGTDAAEAKEEEGPTPVIRTVITFDRGGSWEYLTAPKVDVNGKPVLCSQGLHPGDASGQGTSLVSTHCRYDAAEVRLCTDSSVVIPKHQDDPCVSLRILNFCVVPSVSFL